MSCKQILCLDLITLGVLSPVFMKAEAVIYSFKAKFSLDAFSVALLQTSQSCVLVFVHTQSPQTAEILDILDIYPGL